MTKANPVKFATLHGAIGERVALGWTPREVRARVSKKARSSLEIWLQIHGDVRCPDGAWTFRDPALTEREACELVAFLSVRPWTGEREITFAEPCLAFSTRGASGGLLNVDIRFSGEAAPPFIMDDPERTWYKGFTLGLFVTDDVLRRFTADLREMLGHES